MRGALGASPGRLIRQFVTEGLLLVALGSAAGLAVAYGTIYILQRLIPVDMMERLPFLGDLGLSSHVSLTPKSMTRSIGVVDDVHEDAC